MSNFEKVSIDSFVFADNVRTPECLALDLMVQSILENGWLEESIPVVNSNEKDDYTIKEVLQGNRRCLAIQHIKEHHPEEYVKIFPDDEITCIVHKDLNEREKINIRVDHGSDRDRYPLDDWSKFLAVKQLMTMEDLTQEQIAKKLGLVQLRGPNKGKPNLNDVRVRMNLVHLPQFVQDEMRQYTLDKANTNLRWSHVPRLHKAWRAEFQNHPEGDGPEFAKVWDACLHPEVDEDGKKKNVIALTPGSADKKAKKAQSGILKRILLSITNQSKDKLGDLDNQLVRLEADSKDLTLIKEHLGEEDYTNFMEEVYNKEPEPTAVG